MNVTELKNSQTISTKEKSDFQNSMQNSKTRETTLSDIYNNESTSGTGRTERGTKILQKSESTMGKDAFLRILAAELANQDPTQNVDSTQYVTQLSQFATMEQLQNLNSTMTSAAHNQLIGKGVTLKTTDSNGQNITGVVKAVTESGSRTTLHLIINEDGKNVEKDCDISDVQTVLEGMDYGSSIFNAISNLNGNTQFLLASSFIGNRVQLSEKDSSGNYYLGEVVGVAKINGEINARVKLDSTGEVISVTLNKITNVGDLEDKNSSNEDVDKSDDE